MTTADAIAFMAMVFFAVSTTVLAFWKSEIKPLFIVAAIGWLAMGGFSLTLIGNSAVWRIPAIIGLGMVLVMFAFAVLFFKKDKGKTDADPMDEPFFKADESYRNTRDRIARRMGRRGGGLRKRKPTVED